jgi:hypothetical protein
MTFPKGFQYFQTLASRLFVIGGGPENIPESFSLRQCLELTKVKDLNFFAAT